MADVPPSLFVRDLMGRAARPVCFLPQTPGSEVIRCVGQALHQDVFPVVDSSGRLIGLVSARAVRVLSAELHDSPWTLAADIAQPLVSVRPDDDLRTASELMLQSRLRELPVVGSDGQLAGLLNETDLVSAWMRAVDAREPA